MQGRHLVMSVLVAGMVAFVPSTASAQSPPTCAQLNTDPALGLAGNPTVIAHTTTLIAATGSNRAYCRVDFTVSERGGPEHGYAPGEIQRVVLRVGLPLNSADGGSGGGMLGEGAWNGKVQNLGGGGLVGNVGNVTSATNLGYVGSSTDSGHPASEGSGFGVIQATHELNLGKIEDFFHQSLRLQYQWALRLTKVYYTKRAARNYWSGCSTGGRQGLVLALKHGEDFDGFLIGAPHTNHVHNSSSNRSWVNKDLAGGTLTNEKFAATVERMVIACDGLDGLEDGLVNDPRACTVKSADVNACGLPGAAPAGSCLSAVEAEVADMVFDGPRNDLGHRVWFPYGRATVVTTEVPTAPSTGGNGVYGWAMKDMTFDWRAHPLAEWDNLVELASNSFGDLINMGDPNLSRARNSGAKILMWQGTADNLTFYSNVYYYTRVLDQFGADDVSDWYRYFLAPGVGHCGGGAGPQPQNLFNTLVGWVEDGTAPDSILASGGGRTRPLCAFPQTAIYDGVGDPDLASSFSCGGNLQTKAIKCDGLIVKYKQETGSVYPPLGGETDISCGIAHMPSTSAALGTPGLNDWRADPLVTLNATDEDSDVVRTEYQLDGSSAWTPYAGPFAVADGAHTLTFRSIDSAEHVETARKVAIKVDTADPVLSGLPAACTIAPANGELVKVATITAADALSGVAPRSLAIEVTSNETIGPSDVLVRGGDVYVRASRAGDGTGRVYSIAAQVSDRAGNAASATGTCVVPVN